MRRLFTIASGISLLLFVLTSVIWVQSFRTKLVLLHFRRQQIQWQITVNRGLISVDNQPQLDWEQQVRAELLIQIRYAVKERLAAATAFQRRWLDHYNGWKIEEVPHPDAQTQRLLNDLLSKSRRHAHLMASYRASRTALAQHVLRIEYLVVLCALLPGLWLWRWQVRWRAIARGMCSRCGYDLMGNVSGVCTECGTVISDSGAAAKALRPTGDVGG